ncbi:ABC transporter substrate-binding protein [Burkholderiaceae bacterium 16]|nr:ABC transporter substrate-binding protein [Burkholderiaceae bacterium 16]
MICFTTSARRWLSGLTAGLLWAGLAHAHNYPDRPVTLLVPFAAGGLSDVVARNLNVSLARHLGQPVVVENLGGAGGAIAAQKVLNAPGDGQLIFQAGPGELITAPLANAAVKYKSEAFRMIHMVGAVDMAILARKDLPASNVDELAAYAAQAAKAGKPLTYASVGVGSFYHLLGEHMARTIGVPLMHVPYKGGAPAIQDLVGGVVDIFIAPFGKPDIERMRTGQVKMLAVLSPTRVESVGSVPSVNESKALRGFNFTTWAGLFVKKDTPEPIVQALHKAITQTLAEPAVRANLEAANLPAPKPVSLLQSEQTYRQAIEQFRGIATSIGLQRQ